ncbi:PPIC-type PPIASE domain-containing protein [Fusarium pseudocircinatum]|uniref:PPIC-type PPIASE domain-containing protein n=1 Tax=Fusarium pseudocircinatum TaxID=56676 RepID=A0A8H5PL85_9HYPO|nr:PPIC-type PPIASE domain-containing protein [Fusarium pseudocircinatum]
MCRAVRYVYPECGHAVDPDPKVWVLEKCIPAVSFGRDCWFPRNLPENYIEKKPWPNDNLVEPCRMPHPPAYSDATFEVENAEMQNKEDTPSSVTLSDVGKDDNLTIDDIDSIEGEECDFFAPVEVRFEDEDSPVILADHKSVLADMEPLYLDPADNYHHDEISLLEDGEVEDPELTAYVASRVWTEEENAYFTKVIEDTNEELAMFSAEDNIDWIRVSSVDTSAPLGYDHYFPPETKDEEADMDVQNFHWFKP